MAPARSGGREGGAAGVGEEIKDLQGPTGLALDRVCDPTPSTTMLREDADMAKVCGAQEEGEAVYLTGPFGRDALAQLPFSFTAGADECALGFQRSGSC